MNSKQIFESEAGQFFLRVFNAITDGIWISDGEGRILWVNEASQKLIFGEINHNLIEKTVYDIEEQGILSPSVTRMVIESQKSVSTVQTTRNGRKFLVNGQAITDENRKVMIIIAHAHDITQTVKANIRLEEAESLLKWYSHEVRKMSVEKEEEGEHHFVGKSREYHAMLEWIDKVADVDTTVLLTGETGVGKSYIAKKIHRISSRNKEAFIHLNCGAIPESLIESELFGYKKGSFTGASKEGKPGLIKMAEKGTLFLDEIGEMPFHLQSKLLQFLQNKTYLPIGETKLQHADVRIIAATNNELHEKVKEGTFRADLYYRLNVLPLHIPPLRKRTEDILPFLYFYMERFNKKYKKIRYFSSEATHMLLSYSWPGNIRELENLTERLVITANGDEISPLDLPEWIRASVKGESFLRILDTDESLPDMLMRIEREIIERVYEECGSTRKIAEKLGVTQSYIMRRFKKYNLKVIEEKKLRKD